jgi:hypothetical protein
MTVRVASWSVPGPMGLPKAFTRPGIVGLSGAAASVTTEGCR